MNNENRKQVSALVAELEDLQSKVTTIGETLRELADAEQEKFDNMSEGLQTSDKGQAIEEAAGYLSSAANSAENGDVTACLEELGNLSL